jgi:hypothetical protein
MKPNLELSPAGTEGMDEILHPARRRLSRKKCNSQTWLCALDIWGGSKCPSR